MAELAVQAALVVVETVIIFLHRKFKLSSTGNAQQDLARAKDCLESMRAYLSDYDHEGQSQVLQARVKQVRAIAYQIEDVVDMFMLQVPHHSHSSAISQRTHDFLSFFTVGKPRREFSKQIKDIIDRIDFLQKVDSIHQGPARPQDGQPSSSTATTHRDNYFSHHHRVLEEKEMVGFDEPKQKLIEQLVDGDNSKIISIEGPGGSGKTTLLKIVFDNKRVQGSFDCHAWIDMPRDLSDHKLNDLLLTMLGKLDPKGQRQEPVRHEDPKERLRILLLRKRFVVVLDNVWSRQDLVCILDALPNGLPGSKIIITTRHSSVATGHDEKPPYICNLSEGLSPENARNLFFKKSFPGSGGQCPVQLQQLAKKIVEKCEGLPLAVSAVGTLLATKEQTQREWQNLLDSLIRSLPIISQSWEASYRDLPVHLKTCFLYFSMFPENYSISRERLIRLWVAEGFVMPIRGSPMQDEEIAKGYLDELIDRNLVRASSREIDGRVQSCRVSNLVLEFIISKVENFLIVSGEARSSCHTPGEKIRGLSVHDNVTMINLSMGRDLSCIRTLLVGGKESSHSELERDQLKTLKFLKVLDLQGVALENFPDSVFGLTLLRYISLRKTNIKKVPESIKMLGFLETLDLKHTQVTNLPAEIYALHNLRHLLVYHYEDIKNYVTFGAARGVEVSAGNIAALTSLQKLSLISIKVKNKIKIIRALGKLKGLRKLGLVDLERKDGWELCCSIQKMESLSTLDVRSTSEDEYLGLDQMQSPPRFLQHLYLKGRLETLPQWIRLLHSVTKIGLKWSKLNANQNPLEALQDLSNLMELDLVDYYTGENLEFKAGTFVKLKALRIEQLDQLNTMVVQNNAMPELKKLTLCKCQSLRLLPLGMEGLTKLDELLLFDMHNDFIARLEKNGEDRQVVEHIRVIHSFYLQGTDQSFRRQDLS